MANKDSQHNPLRFDCLDLSISGPEFADQLEKVAPPLLADMVGANFSKLVPFLHDIDGDYSLLN